MMKCVNKLDELPPSSAENNGEMVAVGNSVFMNVYRSAYDTRLGGKWNFVYSTGTPWGRDSKSAHRAKPKPFVNTHGKNVVLVRTSDLSAHALDWAVACCEGFNEGAYMCNIDLRYDVRGKVSAMLVPINRSYVQWSPSRLWAQAGLIIERERIDLMTDDGNWAARMYPDHPLKPMWGHGNTAQVAAMRCYVASKLGDEIEVLASLISDI